LRTIEQSEQGNNEGRTGREKEELLKSEVEEGGRKGRRVTRRRRWKWVAVLGEKAKKRGGEWG